MNDRAANETASYGVLAHIMKDHAYLMDWRGQLFTTPYIVNEGIARSQVSILLTARGLPFELHVNNQVQHLRAAVVKPNTLRYLKAVDVRLISARVAPLHPHFRRLCQIQAPGLLALDRDKFNSFDDAMDAAYQGQLDIEQASRLFEDIIETAANHLPAADAPDPRVTKVIKMLCAQPDCPLEELAAGVELSEDRLRKIFEDAVGITFRSYRLLQKLYKAVSLVNTDLSLTEIAHAAGFTDSAHLCNSVQFLVGGSPSYFFRNDNVKVFGLEKFPLMNKLMAS